MRRLAARLLVMGCASTAGAAGRVEVPLSQRVLSDGTIRYFVTLSLGARPVEAMVDTGSTGLRILPNVVPDAAFASISKQPNVYGYGSGVRLNGVVAMLGVGIGGLSGTGPVGVQLVRTVDCFQNQPGCPASRLSQADYRLGGDGLAKEGFDAILGISMGTGAVDNPLRQLGVETWIVVLPRPGESGPGSLILNPDPAEVAGYTLFPTQQRLKNSPSVPLPDGIPGCLIVQRSGQQICGPTLLDSGAPGISISPGKPADGSGWKKGDQITIAFTNQQGGTIQASFEAGATRPAQLSAAAASTGAQTDTHIAAGTQPCFLF